MIFLLAVFLGADFLFPSREPFSCSESCRKEAPGGGTNKQPSKGSVVFISGRRSRARYTGAMFLLFACACFRQRRVRPPCPSPPLDFYCLAKGDSADASSFEGYAFALTKHVLVGGHFKCHPDSKAPPTLCSKSRRRYLAVFPADGYL